MRTAIFPRQWQPWTAISPLLGESRCIKDPLLAEISFRVYQFSEIIRGHKRSARVLTFILTFLAQVSNIIFVAHCLLIGFPLGISHVGHARKCPLLAIKKKRLLFTKFVLSKWPYICNVLSQYPAILTSCLFGQ